MKDSAVQFFRLSGTISQELLDRIGPEFKLTKGAAAAPPKLLFLVLQC